VGKEGLESFEAILVWLIPLLFSFPLYALGLLTEVAGDYVTYFIYIACSITLTRYNQRTLAEIGLTTKAMLPSLGLSGVLVAAALLRNLIFRHSQFPSSIDYWTVVNGLFYCEFGGFGQEIIFRGLMLYSLQRWKGWKVALIVSSVLFGLMHVRQGVIGIVGTTVVGLYWGWVALQTRNIIGISIVHGLYNSLFAFT